MKIKFLITLACGLMLFSCSTEETNQTNNDDVNFSFTNQESNSRSGTGCPPVICDPNYNFPSPNIGTGYQIINVTYSRSLPVEKIPCVRQEYFECFSFWEFVLPGGQSPNPYEEVWWVPSGKPDSGIDTTLCNDPRTNTECEE